MTIEEKAKAYDEAQKRAKVALDVAADKDLVGGVVRTIFPELRESEDKRILQALIRGFENWKSNGKEAFNFTNVDDILAYLEKQKESHYTKRNALFDKCVENCEPKTVEEVNKRVDDIMNMPELSAFEQALTNFIGDWEDNEERWPSKFVKKHSKHILDMAREELQKEQKGIPLMNGDADLYFDEWNQQHSNPTKRECFEAGMLYAVRLLTEDSPMLEEFKKGLEQVILWAKEGYKVSPDGTTKTLTQDEIDGVLDEQKEQKHPDGCFTCDEYKKGYEEGRRNGFTAGYNKAMKEVEQKEQKPTENEKVEITDFEQSVYDLCPVLGIEEAKATASDLLELAKKTLLKTGKVVLASNYPEGCSFEDGFHLGYNEGFNAKQKEQILKDAVEGMVCATITGTNAISFLSPLPKELTAGDKVRIVILKEKEE